MSITDRLARISPFRWRLEWLVMLAVAVSGVLSDQAREARERDPYLLVHRGRSAQAIVKAPREKIVPLGMRRGETQQEIHSLVDLEWQDDTGQTRRITGYRLDDATLAGLTQAGSQAGLRPDSLRSPMPAYAQVLYLDRSATVRPSPGALSFIRAQGVTAARFQQHCEPWIHCRVIVLAPTVLTSSEEAALNVDYVLDRAPHAFKLSLLLLIAMLGLRLAGVVDNRPSLE